MSTICRIWEIDKIMRCKVCNNELISGSRQCPHCGAVIPDEKKTFGSEFKWNVQDYPKPKKQQDISIDWKSGRIVDENSGKIYDQSLNGWAEPEEIRDLFTFDTKNEKRQQTLDREMDRIFKGSEVSGRKYSEDSRTAAPSDDVQKNDVFHLPASMNLHNSADMSDAQRSLISGLLGDALSSDIEAEHSQTAELSRNTISHPPKTSSENRSAKEGSSEDHFTFQFSSNSGNSHDREKTAEEKTAAPDTFTDDFVKALHNISGDIYGKISDKPAAVKDRGAETAEFLKTADAVSASAGTETEEKKDNETVISGSPEITPGSEEAEIPPGSDETVQKKDTGESDEFSGFHRLIEAEKRFKDDMEKVTYLTPAEYEEAQKAETKSQKLRFVPTISFRTIEDEYEAFRRENGAPRQAPEEDKSVQISINEPSGTKVTVKTQEISLASLNDDKKVQTREVRLDAVKQPPKNVQVSVEINAAQGNASVEVTRRHDGATVVKTVDTSDSGHVYVDGEDRTDYAQFDETSAERKTAGIEPEVHNSQAISKSEEDTAEAAVIGEDFQTDADDDFFAGDLDEKLLPDSDAQVSGDENPCSTEETAKITDDISAADVSDETPQDSVENRPAGRDLKPDKIADGSASSEAAQQTMQIPALEAAALAAALEERKAAQEIRQTMQNSGDMPQDSDMEFWEKPSGISKMTITDIFGPEARQIMSENGKEPDSPIPEIQETGQPKAAGAPISDGCRTESDSETKPNSGEATENPDILSIRPEDIAASRSQTESIYIPSIDPETDHRGITTDTISQQRQTEMMEALDAIDSIKEAERKQREKAEKKAEKERLRAERSQRRAEKKTAREESKASSDPDSEENESLGTVAKTLIILLSVLLVIEFAIIGIKLFAPDSGAATLIHRIETQVTGIFAADDSKISAFGSSEGIQSAAPAADGDINKPQTGI